MADKSVHEVQTVPLSGKSLGSGDPGQTVDTRIIQPWEKPGFKGTSLRYWRAFQRYAWDDPDKSKEEKWFLFKLDLFLLTSASLG